jgi:hypothetical protein
MRRAAALLILAVLASGESRALAADPDNALTLTTSPELLTIANATKGGRVILAGVSVTSERNTRRLRRFAEVLTDTDGDGRIQFVPPGSVPLRSVWAATDLESGATATAPGPGRSVTYLLQIPATAFKKDVDGALTGFESRGVEVQLVVVRPKQGAWMTYAQEGFEGDEDGSRNGVIRAALGASVPLAPEFGSSPSKTKKDDVLILLDLRHLLVGTTVVTN